MYDHINKQLSQSQQDIYRLQKVEAMLVTLKEELSILEEKTQSAKAVLEKEKKDYKKITEKSISSIIYSVLGNLDERAEKERKEALEAELKYNQCVWDLEDIQNQISRLETEKLQYKNAQAEYDKLYDEKYQALMNENSRTAQKIMELNKSMERSKSNQREIDEAISIGHQVENSLTEALKSLNSAEGWGMWDMFGGGLITDMVKHSHIDDASDAAKRTQSLLRRFRTELADVRISEEIQMDISGFAKFADFFFDGILADWFMQSKINTTKESVRTVQNQVQSVMRKLRELKDAEQRIQEDLNTQVSRLIVEA